MDTIPRHEFGDNFDKIISFLNAIGIKLHFSIIDKKTFLPGLSIENGTILVDMDKLKYPGDLLHEAGHVACVPSNERAFLNEEDIAKRPQREAEEMMAIAWSYAACVHLDIDATYVFHNDGYQSGGDSIAENFKEGRYFGVPMLQWTGMAMEKASDLTPSLPIYPNMIHWLRN